MSSQNKIFQREINKDRFDYVLFLVLTCVLALVTLKGFTFAPEIRNDWNSLGFSYDTSIPLILAVPFDLLYVGVAVWFLIRRKVAFGKKQLIMTTIFIILATFRISSYFLFSESVEFSLSNPFDPNQIIDISYSDYALVDKCIECIAEVIFLFHLYLIAMVFPTLNKDKKDNTHSKVMATKKVNDKEKTVVSTKNNKEKPLKEAGDSKSNDKADDNALQAKPADKDADKPVDKSTVEPVSVNENKADNKKDADTKLEKQAENTNKKLREKNLQEEF